MTAWPFFTGSGEPHDFEPPEAPPWRRFLGEPSRERKLPDEKPRVKKFEVGDAERELVSTAICLRRPLLVTGRPGTGKSSLAHSIAHELRLGQVLVWPINTRSTL